jgi:outer membrane protein
MTLGAARFVSLVAAAVLAACSAPPGRPSETADGAEEADVRVAVVDLERVLAETPAGQAAMREFERIGRRLQADLDERREELQALEQAIEQAREDGADQERLGEMLAEYQQKAGMAQQLLQTSQQQLDALRAQLTAPILEDVARIVRRIGRDEGYDLIVERKGLAYIEPDADLTARIIESYGAEVGDAEPSLGAGELRLFGGSDEDDGEGEEPPDADEDADAE